MTDQCVARRVNDEMHCHRCGYQWSVNEVKQTECQTIEQHRRNVGNEAIRNLKHLLNES